MYTLSDESTAIPVGTSGTPLARVFTPFDLGNTGTGEPLDTPVAGVGDVDLASRRDRDRLRGRQHSAAVGPEERGAQVVVLLDHVPRRRDPDVVRSVGGHTDRSAERPGRERRARRVEPIDVVVAGNVDHVRAVDGNAGRVQRAPLRQEVARGVELLDPVVARIGHVHVAERVDRDAFRVDELTVPGSVGAPTRYVVAQAVESLHPVDRVAVPLQDEDITASGRPRRRLGRTPSRPRPVRWPAPGRRSRRGTCRRRRT